MNPRLIAAAALAAALSLASAVQAATFTIAGGDAFTLGGNYDPNPGTPDLAPGASVTRNGALSLADAGASPSAISARKRASPTSSGWTAWRASTPRPRATRPSR